MTSPANNTVSNDLLFAWQRFYSELAGFLRLIPLLLLTACATPVGVKFVDTQTAHQTLTASVLSSGTPTATSNQVLRRLNLDQRFSDDPERVLATLHKELQQGLNDDLVFALAELSFLHAQNSGDHRHYLASAIYSYTLLYPGEGKARLHPSDPRLRLAYDLYNRGLAEGLTGFDEDGDEVVMLKSGKRALPFGTLDIASDNSDFYWMGYRLGPFTPSAKLAVRGLRNRYRKPGVGAPLAAGLASQDASRSVSGASRVPPHIKVPVTAFLRIVDPELSLVAGKLKGRMELYSVYETPTVTVNDREEPLEFEPTAALAYSLEGAPIYDVELGGFLSAGFLQSFFPRDRAGDGLFLMHPYVPGRIPVILVHGTASSPARWAEMMNELEADPRIHDHFQIWLFLYTTGNPIGYSGGRLRAALRNIIHEMDPHGKDSALQRMVVIGHSQGGLLTKLTAIDSGDHFWENISSAPLDSFDIDPEAHELLRQSLFFTPEPFVERVIFIATPQRGSYLAKGWLGGLASWLVKLPGGLLKRGFDAIMHNQEALLIHKLKTPPTSIDNMAPGNPFIRTLASIPVVPRIKAHSIIAVQDDGPANAGSDGVVDYTSAHMDGVVSEFVVRSGHSTQSHPDTIEEVRRILLEHLEAPSADSN